MAELHTHYRRCHRCLYVTSCEGALVQECASCGKHLAPFQFFDESKAMGLQSSFYSKSSGSKKTTLPHEEYPPVRGLTVYWES